jgi:hypothetical protein
MAFLDNSGDIILDAVLTDVGRKRMARGNFQITKFALGDDEIDYGLYNKNHPSGSAYYDLEVLQTPILEAFTQANASLNYGLITYVRNDLLYLPTIVLNTKTSVLNSVVKKDPLTNVIYLCDNSKTNGSAVTTGALLAADVGNRDNALYSGLTNNNYIFIETGINSVDLASTSAMQNTYLLGVGLNDSSFSVSCDGRFITTVLGPTQSTSFVMGTGGGELNVGFVSNTAAVAAAGLQNYREVTVNGITSNLYPSATGTDTTATYSNITGPRGAFTVLNFAVNPNIAQADFSKFGRTASIQRGGAGLTELYDWVDTIVYVRGLSTNIVLQIPIRIIQASQA